MAKKITYGMVGGWLGAFIGDVHRKAIAFDTRAELVCGCFSNVVDENAKTCDYYDIGADRMYENYEDMARIEGEREDGIDFVSVVTPNHLHYRICKAFLNAGINVVCEKPLCFEIHEAEELKELAEKKGLLFAITYSYTGYTMVKVAKDMVKNGDIGDIVAINAEYAQDWLLGMLDSDDGKKPDVWRMNPELSGSVNSVGDIGTHIENTVHYITGLKIKKLLANFNRYGYPLELNANILVDYENGVTGGYWCSQVAAGRENGLAVRIYGTKGSLEWEQHFPDHLRYTPKGEATRLLSKGAGWLTTDGAKSARLPSGHPEGVYIAFANIYRNVIQAMFDRQTGKSVSMDGLDFPNVYHGLDGVKFVKAALFSADNGSCWVEL